MCIRDRPNGRWEGRYTLGIDPATGRAIQKSVSAKTRAECKEKLDRAIRDNRGIPMDHNEDYTVEMCIRDSSENCILEYLTDHASAKCSDISNMLGVKDARARRMLGEMIIEETIVTKGGNRNHIYKL